MMKQTERRGLFYYMRSNSINEKLNLRN